MRKSKFVIDKDKKFKKTKIDLDKNIGFKFSPKQNIKSGRSAISIITILKPSIITTMLKKKVKIKINYFFDIIANDDDSSSDGYREALNDLSRYKDIINYKYKKYFDDKFNTLLMKKLELFEYELKEKIVINSNSIDLYTKDDFKTFDEDEKTSSRRR
jgi:hypothetical protein